MTGTGENVGECRLSYIGEANEAHFEIILTTKDGIMGGPIERNGDGVKLITKHELCSP